MQSSLDLIRQLSALDDNGKRTELVFKNPELLNPKIQVALQEELQTLPPQEGETLQGILLNLNAIRNLIESGEARYIIGVGPIERIWSQMESGEISDDQAAIQTTRLGSENRLSPLYCEHLSGYLIDVAYEGKRETALRRARPLIAAVRALPGGEAELITYANPILDWIEIVKESLIHMGDRRLYQQAQEAGESLVRQATIHKNDLLRGAALHRLGILSLDPYTSGRSSLNYAVEIEVWRHRLAYGYASTLEGTSESEWLMPEPIVALRQAEMLLRQAVDLRQGPEKGLTIKALINDLDWRHYTLKDETVKRDEIIRLAMQAMDALASDENPAAMLDVMGTLNRYETPIPQHHMQWLEGLFSAQTFADYAQRLGDRRAAESALQAAQILGPDRPAQAIRLVQSTQNLIRRFGSEELLVAAWNLEFRLILRLYSGDFEGAQPEDSLQETLQKLQQHSRERGWSQTTIGSHLLHLVIQAAGENREALGLQILDQAAHLAPDIFQNHTGAMLNLRSRLLASVGAEAYNQKLYGDSAVAYVRAIQVLLQLGLDGRSLNVLTNLSDVVNDCDAQTAANLIYDLQPIALEMERKGGPAATRLLQQMYRQINSKLFILGQEEISAVAMNDLWQLAKGLRFAASLGGDNQSDWQDDQRAMSLLRRIAEVESALTPEVESAALDDVESVLTDLALTAYEHEQEQYAGRNTRQRLRNLQNSFDTYLNDVLLSESGNEFSDITPRQIIDALDARTVLINYYIAQTADSNHLTINLLVFTDQSITALNIPTGIKNEWAVVGADQQLLVPPLGIEIFSLRNFITQYPAFPGQPVSKQAAKQLEFSRRLFFGSFLDELDRLRAQGKDHLCVIPHGPLHYLPFHLLGPTKRPLAQDWIVTYLPHIKLLTAPASQAASTARRALSAALGISYQKFNLFQQDQLPQSISEAETVAHIFGSSPALETEATRDCLIAALQSAPYVHLSAHGTHNRQASAFQCLYLAPEESSDGRFFAYELIGLDLRGLEILTLSACESVLGRFDPGDNLRGIPAYLLKGGLKTLIGTLWEARPEPAERFFTTFYKELFDNKSRLDAFAQAQRITRQEFPEYDAWGPFYYIGDWR